MKRLWSSAPPSSLAMRHTLTQLVACARHDATLLLIGETGTGKGLAARAVHQASDRASGPFEVLDCGSVAPSLIQSELFGHMAGAFTGAVRARAGVFQRARGGTVFLDEIGELPLEVQATLLRVTEAREVVPLGSERPVPIDVRLIAATHADLASGVRDGWFREDLYYRLNVVTVTMPALRQRLTDLPALVEELLWELGLEEPGPIDGPNLQRLERHDWPGNVRELRNVLERAVVSSGATSFRALAVAIDTLPLAPRGSSFREQKQAAVEAFERQYLAELLQDNDGNIKQSSRASGLERTHLKRLLRKHGLLERTELPSTRR